ncbi:uncharacterized protein LOC124269001 [Haliotis rubra]|uniref:uncharacterized protein LOC124269001 n=1 Tax=Haliotis rubra TaxID=36100 RepID=UPI001EE5B457|nr:uncharacterized protein LOC124269001 [Haliotis rubra]
MATAPAEYVILDMNANGDSKAGMREKRKHHIADVLMSKSPLVVCLQEFVWVGIHSRGWKEFDVPDHFQYEGHKEAGFIFDAREITYSRIDNKTSVRNMYDNMVKRSDMVSDYFELPRLCVFKIQSKGAPHFEILCASWHGPHRVSMEKKKKALDTLVKFLLKLKVEEENIPLLLGGDFNMPASAVERRLPSNGSLMLNTPDDSSIDMFIVSSDIVQIFSISKVHTMKKHSAFDHLHLEMNFVNDTNLEEQIKTNKLSTGDKGPHACICSEQTLSAMKKITSPSVVASKQNTEGQKRMKEAKGADNKMPKSSEQTLSLTMKKVLLSEVESKQKAKGQERMKKAKSMK